ncbi:MAG TPA: hypothetical protein DCL83_05140, partial [Arthrobacter bacterium]|nr:hypothetical protein [Arthrobacter sp.]
ADHSTRRNTGISLATMSRGVTRTAARDAPWLLMGAKTLSYAVNMAATREARRRGADEALFHTVDGFVMEGPVSSVVMRRGNVLLTPDPGIGILEGTTQRMSSLTPHHSDSSRSTSRSIRTNSPQWTLCGCSGAGAWRFRCTASTAPMCRQTPR